MLDSFWIDFDDNQLFCLESVHQRPKTLVKIFNGLELTEKDRFSIDEWKGIGQIIVQNGKVFIGQGRRQRKGQVLIYSKSGQRLGEISVAKTNAFTIDGDDLFAVSQSGVDLYDLQSNQLKKSHKKRVDLDSLSLFVHGDQLFELSSDNIMLMEQPRSLSGSYYRMFPPPPGDSGRGNAYFLAGIHKRTNQLFILEDWRRVLVYE